MSGCYVGCKFCLLPDSSITMSDFTVKKIKDIKIGDDILGNILTKGSNEETSYYSKHFRSSKVLNTFKREYNDDIYIIKTKSGNILKLTPNHRVSCKTKNIFRNKYTKADLLKVGDFVYSTFNFNNIFNSDEYLFGWLYGFIKGDGCYFQNHDRKCHSYKVSQSNSLIYLAFDLCKKFNMITSNIWEYNVKNKDYKTNYNFSFGEKSIKIFEDLFNKYFENINFKKGFLSGFWDAEGYSFCNNKNVKVCNSNIEFLKLFGSYVKDLGFSFKIKKYKSNDIYICETNINRSEFVSLCNPKHEKFKFLKDNIKVKKMAFEDEIIEIQVEKYKGFVYNFETDSHTYVSDNVAVHNCATGQLKKFRNLTAQEIVEQIEFVIAKNPEYKFTDAKEHKINYTRMGEPFLNIDAVKEAIKIIDDKYPNTHHYISTIGIKDADYSWIKDNITLQVSVHSLIEEKRNNLIPFKNKVTIEELGKIRTKSNLKTTVNMTLVDEDDFDIDLLVKYFDKDSFFIKLSPINVNEVSEQNHMGKGAIEGVNLI